MTENKRVIMGWDCSADDGVCEQNSPVLNYAIQVYGIVAFVALFILSIYAAKTNERISCAYFKKIHANVLVFG